MEETKKILLSGKLSGTRTFSSELEQIENPDNIEKFLLYFSKLKIDLNNINELLNDINDYQSSSNTVDDCTIENKEENKIIYINDDQDLLEINDLILNSAFISIYYTDNFSRLYITLDSGDTIIIRLNKVSPAIIGLFISKETTIKYAINSFNFIKWCNSNNIDIKNLFDIPTYIKLLTNDVDPFKTVENYLTQYTTYEFDNENNEKNNIAISNFIYIFGQLLSKYVKEFDLSTISKSINENSYFEGNTFNNTGNCIIKIAYTNVDIVIANILEDIVSKYKEKAYIISPLNRIAPKFRQNITNLIHEIFAEDLSITILNELCNNNIPVKLDYETNTYIITCKFKNFANVINLINAIFSETFFTIFEQTPEIHMECTIKE